MISQTQSLPFLRPKSPCISCAHQQKYDIDHSSLPPPPPKPPPQPPQPPKIKPTRHKNHPEIKRTISSKNAIIQPLTLIAQIKPPQKFIPVRILAELAQAVAAVLHIAACPRDEGCRVGLAALAGRRGEAGEFVRGADDGAVVGGDAEEAFY